MATTDWQRVAEGVKDYLDAKHGRGENSFGHRELTDLITRLERENRLPESLVTKALRHYGEELSDVLTARSNTEAGASGDGNGQAFTTS